MDKMPYMRNSYKKHTTMSANWPW